MTNKQKEEIVELLEKHRIERPFCQHDEELNKKLNELIFAVKSSSKWVSKIPMW
jgi:hypothetical protein